MYQRPSRYCTSPSKTESRNRLTKPNKESFATWGRFPQSCLRGVNLKFCNDRFSHHRLHFQLYLNA